MRRTGLLLGLVAVVGLGLTMMVVAQDKPVDKPKDDKKADVKTVTGQVVDLHKYLKARSEGKKWEEAAKDAATAIKEGVKEAVRDVTGKEEPAPKPDVKTDATKGHQGHIGVKALLVTDKDWLSKVLPGKDHELYVLLCDRASGDSTKAMEGMTKDVGKMIKVTGYVYDEDGVRGICITKYEAVPEK